MIIPGKSDRTVLTVNNNNSENDDLASPESSAGGGGSLYRPVHPAFLSVLERQ